MLDPKINTLLTVYEENSFAQAAKKLTLTQPAVSNQICQLEQQIGHTLCVRTHNSLSFTPAGKIAVNYARRFKALYSQMLVDISEADACRHIKIGITQATGSNPIVTKALGQFITNNAGMNVTIIACPSNILFEKLETYEFDIIIADTEPTSSLLASRILDSDQIFCIVGKGNALYGQSTIYLEDLKKERLILNSPVSITRLVFESALESIHESIDNFNIGLEVDSNSTIKMLVKRNIAVSIMSRKNCLRELDTRSFTAIPIHNLKINQEIYLVHRKDFLHTHYLDEIQRLYGIYELSEYN